MRCHPSTRTKSKILNGKETVTGGNIIIPIESRVLDTTMSMMMNIEILSDNVWLQEFATNMELQGTLKIN